MGTEYLSEGSFDLPLENKAIAEMMKLFLSCQRCSKMSTKPKQLSCTHTICIKCVLSERKRNIESGMKRLDYSRSQKSNYNLFVFQKPGSWNAQYVTEYQFGGIVKASWQDWTITYWCSELSNKWLEIQICLMQRFRSNLGKHTMLSMIYTEYWLSSFRSIEI